MLFRIVVLALILCPHLAWCANQGMVVTSLDKDYETRLNQAAANGYGLTDVFVFVSDVDENHARTAGESGWGADYSEALLFVLRPSSQHLSYKVMTVLDLIGAEKQLNAAGAQGYAVHGSDVFMLRRYGWELSRVGYTIVLQQDTSHTYEFRNVDATRRGFGEQVTKAQSEGFTVVQYLSNGIFVLQREKGVRSGIPSHFSVVQDEDPHRVEKALNDSGAKGFAARFITPVRSKSTSGMTTTVISELQAGRFEYRVLLSDRLSQLQDALAQTSKAGFCIVPSGVFGIRRRLLRDPRGLVSLPDTAMLIMQKAGASGLCDYELEMRGDAKQALERISELAGAGKEIAGIASTPPAQFIIIRVNP